MNAETFTSLEPTGQPLKANATFRKLPRVEIDFETRSPVDLKLAGAYRYAMDPATTVLCMVYKFPNEEPKLWHPGLPDPHDLFFWIEDGGMVEAHNAEFEFVIWNFVQRRHGWPMLNWNQLICSAAKAAAAGLPRALEDVCDVLDTEIKKDKDGKKVMLRLSKLKKPSKKEPDCWDEDPEKRKKLFAYCVDDVLSENAVSEMLPDLTPRQQKFWAMTARINERGVYCDTELCRIAYNFAKRFEIDIQRELKVVSKNLISTAKQVAKIRAYLEARGYPITDLKAQTIDEFIKQDGLPFDVKRILEIRQAINRSSVTKFSRMLAMSGPDKRIRGTLLFHGAGTGRDAGRGIQPQNYPRGAGKKADDILAVLALDDYELFKERYPNVFQALSNSLRGMLRASPGHTLLSADFSGIEARGVMWLAGQDDALNDYRNNVDQYIKQAANIYNKPIEEILKDSVERFLGKQSVLGCFEENTIVLTSNGPKKIIEVNRNDKVWDGFNWVSHSGVLYQGIKETINAFGVNATPDHLFLTGDGWQKFQVLKENLNFQKSALELGQSLLKVMNTGFGAEQLLLKFRAFATEQKFTTLTRAMLETGEQLVATFAQKSLQQTHENFIGVMKTLCRTRFTANEFLTGLVPNLAGATTQRINTSIHTAGAALKSSNLGVKTEENFCSTFKPLVVGTTPNLNWTESTTTGTMNPATFVSFLKATMQKTKDAFQKCKNESTNLKKKTHVFDLWQCGPFNRFTILTSKGPMIVHNCGYGMGKDKFKITCAGYGVDVSVELAEKAVKTYRNTFYKVPQMWRNYEAAFVNAIERPGRIFKANKCSFYVDGRFAFIVLPSGRRLSYRDPQLVTSNTQWGERKQIVYWASDSQTKQWRPEKTYGGKITENICQAVSFDLMIEACARHEMNDFPTVMRVHDELISEVKDEGEAINKKNLDEFMRLMKVLPTWAEGFPVEVEGHFGPRYRK